MRRVICVRVQRKERIVLRKNDCKEKKNEREREDIKREHMCAHNNRLTRGIKRVRESERKRKRFF